MDTITAPPSWSVYHSVYYSVFSQYTGQYSLSILYTQYSLSILVSILLSILVSILLGIPSVVLWCLCCSWLGCLPMLPNMQERSVDCFTTVSTQRDLTERLYTSMAASTQHNMHKVSTFSPVWGIRYFLTLSLSLLLSLCDISVKGCLWSLNTSSREGAIRCWTRSFLPSRKDT